MPTAQATTFILVPGSFVTPSEYDKVIGLLEQKGRKYQTVGLATVNDGSKMPPATYEDDVSLIRSAVLNVLDNEKRNVVLVMHSYGGIPGSSAIQGLSPQDRSTAGQTTAVTGLVYIASFLPILGESLRSIMWDYLPEGFREGCPGEYLPAVGPESLPFCFNDVTDQAEIAKYHGEMERHASDSYNGTATYEAWKDIDSVQIIPQIDYIVPTAVQESMHERTLKQDGKVRRVAVEGGSHALNVSQPRLLVREMLAVAGFESAGGSDGTGSKI